MIRPNPRLFAIAPAARTWLILSIILGALGGLLLVGQTWLLTWIINSVFINHLRLADVYGQLSWFGACLLARAAAAWGAETASGKTAAIAKSELRSRLTNHLMALGPAYTTRQRTGELSTALLDGVESLDAYFRGYLPRLALAALVPLAILLTVFPVDILSGAVLLVTAPLIPVFMILIGSLAGSISRSRWKTLRRLSAYFLDVVQGLPTLKMFGRSKDQIVTIGLLSERFRHTTMEVLRVAFLSALALELIGALSTAVVAVEIGLRLVYSQISFSQALFVLVLAPEFYLPMRTLGASFHSATSGITAAERIFEIFDTKPQHTGGDALPPRTATAPHIRFEDVTLTYPDETGERAALDHVSFEIAPGETVALVGASGAGKSSIARLLMGFVTASGGVITVDGIPFDRLDLDAWRRQVAWVPQSAYLFNDTLAENIRLGKPQASDESVRRAAELAHAHEFITALPGGYATPAGERGTSLSGGQAQRIALARAFLADAALVVLDEPTVYLDPESGALIQESIERLVAPRSALIIAHRLGSIVSADRITVLDGGRIAESGTHDELIARRGAYWRLLEAGAEGMPDDDLPVEEDNAPLFLHETSSTIAPQAGDASTRQSAWKVIARLLALASTVWKGVALATLLSFLTIGSSVGLMSGSAWLISAAALHPSIGDLQVAIVSVRFFGIARGAFRYAERLVAHDTTFQLLKRIRVWFYERLERLAPARLSMRRSGDLLTRIISDVDELENLYMRVLGPPLVALISGLTMAGGLGLFDWRLAASLAIFFGIDGLALPWLIGRLSEGPGKASVRLRAGLGAALVDGVQGIEDLAAFGAAARASRKIEDLSRGLTRCQQVVTRVDALRNSLLIVITGGAMLASLVIAIPRVDGIVLAAIVLGIAASFEALAPLPLAAQHLGTTLEAARRLYEIADAQPAVVDPAAPGTTGTNLYPASSGVNPPVGLPAPAHFDIEFQDVSFRYAPDATLALNGVSFSLHEGEHLLVVGPSGAGKSTLINLLLRFWEYDRGAILFGGKPLREYRQEDLRAWIGVVSQHTQLFNATVLDNLLLTRPDATRAQVIEAARGAYIHDWIKGLPQGYETWIGEQGMWLSGGERQRIAIARALLKDAPVFVFDEPTSHLEAISARGVFETIRVGLRGRSVLIISHQPLGPGAADRVITLPQGSSNSL